MFFVKCEANTNIVAPDEITNQACLDRHDLVNPEHRNRFTVADLIGCRLSANFINAFTNIHKLLIFENTDPYIGFEDRIQQGIT